MTRVHRFANPKRGVVAKRDRQQECLSARVLAFGNRQRRRDDWRAGMHRRAFVDVVELEDVRRNAVGQRRAGGGRSTGTEHDRLI